MTMTPIRDHFLIGDLHTAALVSKDGSIDWLCLPHFDSPSAFAALLDEEKGGCFRVAAEGFKTSARYLPYTAIVETTFEGKNATFTLKDFMLPRPTEEAVPHYVVRDFTGARGKTRIALTFDPRPNYARQRSIFSKENDRLYGMHIDEHALWLHLPAGASVRPRPGKCGLDISFDLSEGETKQITLEYAVESRLQLSKRDLERETIDFWREWITEGNFDFSREHLVRSAITIKLMQFFPTGGLIAAPTTSLPRKNGGAHNRDRRHVSLRDATFSLYAFYVLGFVKEAEKFFRFIERIAQDAKRCEGDDCDLDLSTMYTIRGQPLQSEFSLEHLSGFDGVKPVLVGDASAERFHIDVCGSLIDAYYFMSKRGLKLSAEGKDVVKMLVRAIGMRWKHPDGGIRDAHDERQFTYGKVMAWLGVERALRLANELKISDAQRKAWEKLKTEIEEWIRTECFDEKRGTFTRHPDTKDSDATNFMFVPLFFMNRHDPQAKTMIEATRKDLVKDDIFVRRDSNDRGGADFFSMFSHIAAASAIGEAEEADRMLTKIESLMPSSGLIAEEIDPKTGAYFGNFPQAFSHIGYIMAAFYVHRYREK